MVAESMHVCMYVNYVKYLHIIKDDIKSAYKLLQEKKSPDTLHSDF